MSKRGVTFTKPEEPSFLRKLKEQVGYKEGPTVETKKEGLALATAEDFEDTAEEQPTVVVLRSGDLSADEAAKIKEQLKTEAEQSPADLSARIVFKASSKNKKALYSDQQQSSGSKRPSSSEETEEKPKKAKTKALLSFDEEENDDY